MSDDSCPPLSPIPRKASDIDEPSCADFELSSLVADPLQVDDSRQLIEIRTGIEKLKVFQTLSSPIDNENERIQVQTPPPIETEDYPLSLTPPNFEGEYDNFDDKKHKPESPSEANIETYKSRLSNFKRTLSSPPSMNLSNTTSEKNTINRHGYLLSIPQSPAPNMLQHSILTPITRNTYLGENDNSQGHFIVSPEEKLSGKHISNLAMPGANELKFSKEEGETTSHISFSLNQNHSLNSLPDEICLSSENYVDAVVDSPPLTPYRQNTHVPSLHLSRESPRSRSVDNLDSNSVLQTELVSENSKSPVTLPDESEHNMIASYYNNISAPSEFFEHLAYNNLDPMKVPNLNSNEESNNSFSSVTLARKKPVFYRGRSMNVDLSREKINDTNTYEFTKPTLQYQPSRRDDSLTDVGISKNTEGVDDIFATRSPSHDAKHNAKNNENNTKNSIVDNTMTLSSSIKKPITLEDRQFSIPSLHLANRLGNDSTASFTDGSYSWGDDEEEDFKYCNFDAGDEVNVHMKNSQLFLPDQRARQKVEVDQISQVAVGSVSTDVNNVSLTEDKSSTNDECNNMTPQVIVEVSEEIISKKEIKINSLSMKKHGNPLEWIHEIQCESENKIGESASSKFLTKGISTNTALLNRNRLGNKIDKVSINRNRLGNKIDKVSMGSTVSKNADYPMLARGL